MGQKQYTMKEIKERFDFSAPWVRKLESIGLLKFEAPKGRGRRGRLYSETELRFIGYVSALRHLGVTLEFIQESLVKSEQLKGLINKYKTTDSGGTPVFALFLHSLNESIGVAEKVRVRWSEIPENDAKEIKALLFWFFEGTKKVMRQVERHKKMVEFMQKVVDFWSQTALPKMTKVLEEIP